MSSFLVSDFLILYARDYWSHGAWKSSLRYSILKNRIMQRWSPCLNPCSRYASVVCVYLLFQQPSMLQIWRSERSKTISQVWLLTFSSCLKALVQEMRVPLGNLSKFWGAKGCWNCWCLFEITCWNHSENQVSITVYFDSKNFLTCFQEKLFLMNNVDTTFKNRVTRL